MPKKSLLTPLPFTLSAGFGLLAIHTVIASDYPGIVEFQVSPIGNVTVKLNGQPLPPASTEGPSPAR